MNYLWVALGGALGATARYALSLAPIKASLPLHTLTANALGALLIGVIVGLAEQKGASSASLLFWKTGVCGGFTTFSTFSLEAANLFEKKAYWLGALYLALSVGLCLLCVYLGKKIAT